jgi:hypothetical protein
VKHKQLFENWRRYLNEEQSDNIRVFTFNEQEVRELGKSIARIVSTAKKALVADGAIPNIRSALEATILDPSHQDATPLLKVAEGDETEEKWRARLRQGGKFTPEEEEERMALRKRYYGPGGEVETSAPRARKGLEKGIGRMTAAEFEETGYVMRVPEEVLADFQLLVEETKKTGMLYEQARDWYHSIRDLLTQETNSDRDAALLGLMVATYSPRSKFALNLAEAAFMFKAIQKDTLDNPEFLQEYMQTWPARKGVTDPEAPRGFTKALKVPNFALNLIAPKLAGYRDENGDLVYNDMYMWNSTIDTWMIDAFYPMLRKASTTKEYEAIKGKLMGDAISYRYMTQVVAEEAKKLNILPHELQAIIWVSMQIRQTGEAGLGVTTEFAINQIKQSITNIRLINGDLASIEKEFEEKSWLGILFDEIDNEGFDAAAKFILGAGKGKEKIPGVRGITSRGKKGSAFKYFPEEPLEKKATGARSAKPKVAKAPAVKQWKDPAYESLATYYVMNNVIQMVSGKFNNLYDSVMLYLDPEFTTLRAVEYIESRFNPEALATKEYFTEVLRKVGKKKWCLYSRKKL